MIFNKKYKIYLNTLLFIGIGLYYTFEKISTYNILKKINNKINIIDKRMKKYSWEYYE